MSKNVNSPFNKNLSIRWYLLFKIGIADLRKWPLVVMSLLLCSPHKVCTKEMSDGEFPPTHSDINYSLERSKIVSNIRTVRIDSMPFPNPH